MPTKPTYVHIFAIASVDLLFCAMDSWLGAAVGSTFILILVFGVSSFKKGDESIEVIGVPDPEGEEEPPFDEDVDDEDTVRAKILSLLDHGPANFGALCKRLEVETEDEANTVLRVLHVLVGKEIIFLEQSGMFAKNEPN